MKLCTTIQLCQWLSVREFNKDRIESCFNLQNPSKLSNVHIDFHDISHGFLMDFSVFFHVFPPSFGVQEGPPGRDRYLTFALICSFMTSQLCTWSSARCWTMGSYDGKKTIEMEPDEFLTRKILKTSTFVLIHANGIQWLGETMRNQQINMLIVGWLQSADSAGAKHGRGTLLDLCCAQ